MKKKKTVFMASALIFTLTFGGCGGCVACNGTTPATTPTVTEAPTNTTHFFKHKDI